MIFIKDDEFIRGKCPMTKEEIRVISISKMNLKEDSFVLDVGCGTGSITVQASKIAKQGKVLAIEKEEEAYNITKNNVEKFECNNVMVLNKKATNALYALYDEEVEFDSIFIGGSSGELEEIIKICDNILSSDGTIVMNFITLDNAYKAIEAMKKLNYKVDVSMVNISKNRGDTLMMISLNPIYIIQCRRGEE
ncbi:MULTISPECIES: precorrin-6Y C5,15-methyltransferase (decarboxylating) subunit CbiT [Clostridium]|uniref:Precorrin-6Y C5,15-methyltransferase (Decarboxylating), CbiT subunit n=1 Tax=Clostridium botulinum (strain Eklund 17B / Type B) TaxID=935198 RepID=B2TPG4_CLOBB|nr:MULTISPECIES: precorrin-6Y C5,15-methyltransferase (decarboxylating) subunit CbiT [Clostridium]ACD23958.1 precorrin-6Y C5,15-methyltransferase (decarboxylating), CbiT subunit [Clostridium botulinum B str. Eklund 17B (NRP)]MBN1039522.1 precorrin-6Y C5,15-methyltransferase (decarboxylating) subunit CbiT [Clostridium botulinum]MBN1046370.1 precorrin-6Y C5,15-methyltransferase (decarboxylating) subunit CbiT [Clostridium botulinum]MBN1056269.1 precorrin-6Y C5,15-methyltransferase (decarboxylating